MTLASLTLRVVKSLTDQPRILFGVWFLFIWLCAIYILCSGRNELTFLVRWLMMFATITLILRCSSRATIYYFLSPLFLMGLITLIFYSLAPAIYGQFFSKVPTYFLIIGMGPSHQNAIEFLGSNAELLILQFSALCFLIMSLMLKWDVKSKYGQQRLKINPHCPPYCLYSLNVVVLILGTLLFISKEALPSPDFPSLNVWSEARHALMPLMSFSVIALAYFSAQEKAFFKFIGLISITLCAFSTIFSGLTATPIYLFIIVAFLFLFRVFHKPKSLLISSSMIFLIIPILILITMVARGELKNITKPAAIIQYSVAKLASKIILRQTTSGSCLNGIYNNHISAESGDPFFFTIAFVPRITWPQKPILSRGSEYAEKYCGQSGAIRTKHSESITLLGEPLLNGGILGVVMAQLIIATLLMIGGAFIGSKNTTYIIFVIALLPWLTTFEQHFAEYLGNLVKVVIIMLPLFLVLNYSLRQHNKI